MRLERYAWKDAIDMIMAKYLYVFLVSIKSSSLSLNLNVPCTKSRAFFLQPTAQHTQTPYPTCFTLRKHPLPPPPGTSSKTRRAFAKLPCPPARKTAMPHSSWHRKAPIRAAHVAVHEICCAMTPRCHVRALGTRKYTIAASLGLLRTPSFRESRVYPGGHEGAGLSQGIKGPRWPKRLCIMYLSQAAVH